MKKIMVLILIVFLFFSCEQEPEITYTITYFGNENTSGSVPVDTNQYKAGNTAIIKSKGNLSKINHSFIHWNTKSDNTGDTFYESNSITINSDITLFAIWVETEKYSVSFINDGELYLDEIFVFYGEKINKPENPIKPYYNFIGWFKDENLSIEWNFLSDIITDNTTLYAKWGIIIPNNVIITSGFWNEDANRYQIQFTNPYEEDIIHIEVLLDGKLYSEVLSTYVGVYLYREYSFVDDDDYVPFNNGSVVTIKKVHINGQKSSGVTHIITGIPEPNLDVTITSGYYNENENRYEIYFIKSNIISIEKILVYINDQFYNNLSSTFTVLYLYGVENGDIVTIYTENNSGVLSNGVSHTISGTPSIDIEVVLNNGNKYVYFDSNGNYISGLESNPEIILFQIPGNWLIPKSAITYNIVDQIQGITINENGIMNIATNVNLPNSVNYFNIQAIFKGNTYNATLTIRKFIN